MHRNEPQRPQRRPAERGEQARDPDGHEHRADHDELERDEAGPAALGRARRCCRRPSAAASRAAAATQRTGRRARRPRRRHPPSTRTAAASAARRRAAPRPRRRRRARPAASPRSRCRRRRRPRASSGPLRRATPRTTSQTERGRAQDVEGRRGDEVPDGERERRTPPCSPPRSAGRAARRRPRARRAPPARSSPPPRAPTAAGAGRASPARGRASPELTSGTSGGWSGYPSAGMRAGDDEVQLVAVEAVPGARREEHEELRSGDRRDPAGEARGARLIAPDRVGTAHTEQLDRSAVDEGPSRLLRVGAGRSRSSRCGTS